MHKFTRRLIVGVVTLGLLAPVATTSLNPIRTTVNAESTGAWYKHNAKWLYRHYRHYRMFRYGYNDGSAEGAGTIGGTRVSRHYRDSSLYRKGWIVGNVNGGVMGAHFKGSHYLMGVKSANTRQYNHSVYLFNKGSRYARHHHATYAWLQLHNRFATSPNAEFE